MASRRIMMERSAQKSVIAALYRLWRKDCLSFDECSAASVKPMGKFFDLLVTDAGVMFVLLQEGKMDHMPSMITLSSLFISVEPNLKVLLGNTLHREKRGGKLLFATADAMREVIDEFHFV
jgi:hypothetical protein